MGQPTISVRPFQRLYLDLSGPYTRSSSVDIAVITVINPFSKFHFLEPIRNLYTQNIVTFLGK